MKKTKSRTVTKKLEDELSIEKHEIQITTQVLVNSFKKLFEKINKIEEFLEYMRVESKDKTVAENSEILFIVNKLEAVIDNRINQLENNQKLIRNTNKLNKFMEDSKP